MFLHHPYLEKYKKQIFRNMIINIAASGRFHLCDLARELEKKGHTIRFYSYVPQKRLMSFGLSKKSCYSLFWIMLPVLACIKLSKRSVWSMKLEWFVLDHIVGLFMKKCDVFIAMSSIYSFAFRQAKSKFDAKTILERGSVHAYSLKELYDSQGYDRNATKNNSYYSLVSDYAINRELEMYNFVDYISIASSSVYKTFVDNNIPKEKLFVNPYGVDLSIFSPNPIEEHDVYDIIMVGNWSWMKGCDMLEEACREMNLRLIHVGSCSMAFPFSNNFLDIGPVDQKEIPKYFRKARISVLASRQEGLAMVQLQALASGLPLVCSKYTGGETIRDMIANKEAICVFDPYDKVSLKLAIKKALDISYSERKDRVLIEDVDSTFSSESYAKRYEDFLLTLH